jgi:hypothetical protein
MGEIWKPIPGYEGHYEASSLGRTRSVDRQVVTSRIKADGTPVTENRVGRIRKTRHAKDGYLLVNLSVDGIRKTVSVHPLVCAAFHGPKPGPQFVSCHNNGIRDDCRSDNLRWDTQSGNLKDRHAHGTAPTGENQYGAKLTWDAVREIRASNDNVHALADRYGVYHGHVRKILRNEKWVA